MERKYVSRIVLKSGERLEPYLRELSAVQHLLSGKTLSFPADAGHLIRGGFGVLVLFSCKIKKYSV